MTDIDREHFRKGKLMKRTIIAAAVVALSGTSAFAGSATEGRHVEMCVEAAEAYAGVYLDEFDADYDDGGWLGTSVVTWPNASCEPLKIFGAELVYSLTVNGTEYIVEGYAGRDALNTSKVIEAEVDAAIKELEKRISILKNTAKKADNNLRSVDADTDKMLEKVRTRIDKAVN